MHDLEGLFCKTGKSLDNWTNSQNGKTTSTRLKLAGPTVEGGVAGLMLTMGLGPVGSGGGRHGAAGVWPHPWASAQSVDR